MTDLSISITLIIHIIGHLLGESTGEVLKQIYHGLKTHSKPVNHDLQKALRRSFLSALQDITLDCLEKEPQFLRYSFPPQDLRWLDQHYKTLAMQLAQLKRSQTTENSFRTLEDIQTLLTPQWQLPEERAQVKHKLIAEALSDDSAPKCYRDQVQHDQAGLFERVCDYFASEIKHNPAVRHIFDSQTLARIDAKLSEAVAQIRYDLLGITHTLTQMNETLAQIKTKLFTETTARIKMEVNLADFSVAQVVSIIQTMKQQGLTTLRIEAGSIIIVVAGQPSAIAQLHRLFNTGQLSQSLGVPVLEVRDGWEDEQASHSSKPVNLTAWLQYRFEEAVAAGWQTVEDVFGNRMLSPAFMGEPLAVRRAKQIQVGDQQFDLRLDLSQTDSQEVKVVLVVYPTENQPRLPETLEIRVLQGETLLVEIPVQQHPKGIRQELFFNRGEQFSLQVTLDGVSVMETFEV
jgi:hypothetical protein